MSFLLLRSRLVGGYCGLIVLYGVLVVLPGGDRHLGAAEPWPMLLKRSSSALGVGSQAPPFTAPDVQGQALALQAYQGRPVVLNFWATWCGPCRPEMSALQAVYEAHHQTGLVILAVSQDEEGKGDVVREYVSSLGLTFVALLDAGGSVATQYGVIVLPTTFFINPAGMITAIHRGPMTQGQIERHLAAMLPQPG